MGACGRVDLKHIGKLLALTGCLAIGGIIMENVRVVFLNDYSRIIEGAVVGAEFYGTAQVTHDAMEDDGYTVVEYKLDNAKYTDRHKRYNELTDADPVCVNKVDDAYYWECCNCDAPNDFAVIYENQE